MRVDLVDPGADDVAAAVDSLLEGQNITSVARDLGVARETVYRWRRGESEPTLPELASMARSTEGTIIIRLNDQRTPSIEDEIAELKRAVEGFYTGRAIVVEMFEKLEASEDPEVQALLARLRQLGFRPR